MFGRFIIGGKVPTINLSTLPLTLYFRSEDLVITHPGPGQANVKWVSHSSIGTSGDGREASLIGSNTAALDSGPSLGFGQPTLFLNKPVNNQVPIFTDNTDTVTIKDTDVITTTACSFWALVYIITITGGSGSFADQQIMGVNQPRMAMLVGGVANNKAETEAAFATIAKATVSTGVWTVIQSRFDSAGNGIEVRVNQGSWAPHAQGALSLFGEAFVLGAGGQGASMNGYYANLGASKTKFDDITFDNIYLSLKATYPGASLP